MIQICPAKRRTEWFGSVVKVKTQQTGKISGLSNTTQTQECPNSSILTKTRTDITRQQSLHTSKNPNVSNTLSIWQLKSNELISQRCYHGISASCSNIHFSSAPVSLFPTSHAIQKRYKKRDLKARHLATKAISAPMYFLVQTCYA